jgi:hypothetical protein
MDVRGFILSMAIYIAFYVAACNIALANYLEEFPDDPRRPRSGSFADFAKCLFSAKMTWKRNFLPRDSSSMLRFQVSLCRWMLVGLPVYAVYLVMVL